MPLKYETIRKVHEYKEVKVPGNWHADEETSAKLTHNAEVLLEICADVDRSTWAKLTAVNLFIEKTAELVPDDTSKSFYEAYGFVLNVGKALYLASYIVTQLFGDAYGG